MPMIYICPTNKVLLTPPSFWNFLYFVSWLDLWFIFALTNLVVFDVGKFEEESETQLLNQLRSIATNDINHQYVNQDDYITDSSPPTCDAMELMLQGGKISEGRTNPTSAKVGSVRLTRV